MKKLRDLVPGTGGPLVGMALRLETAEGVEFMLIAPDIDDLKSISGRPEISADKFLEVIIAPMSKIKVVDMDKVSQTTH